MLNYLPTQFILGKTETTIKEIIKRSQLLEFSNNNLFRCNLVFNRNSITEGKQWNIRIKNKIKRVIMFSSDKDSIINNEIQLQRLFTDSKEDRDLPSCLVMCNHPKRIADVKGLIMNFLKGTISLPVSVSYKSVVFSVYFDEAPKGVGNIEKFLSYFVKNDIPPIISDIMYITATPEEKRFQKMLEKLGIKHLQRDWKIDQLSDKEYEDMKKKYYRDISKHELVFYDNMTEDPVDYVRTYLPCIKSSDPKIIFAPSTFRTKGHDQMSDLFLDAGYIVLLHNGTYKGFIFPDRTRISISDFQKKYKVQGELRDVMVKFRQKYKKHNLCITGNDTIGTGITWNTKGFNFTHSFISNYHMKSITDLVQILGRSTGHSDYVQPHKIICPKVVYDKYNTHIKNLEHLMKENPKIISCGQFVGLDKEEYMAYEVPILVDITVKDVITLSTLNKKEKYDKIYELCRDKLILKCETYCRDNLIYYTTPNTDNSYKKHILNTKEMILTNKKGGAMDIKWDRHSTHHSHKCWWVYIDNRQNKIIIILWNGENLPDRIKQKYKKNN